MALSDLARISASLCLCGLISSLPNDSKSCQGEVTLRRVILPLVLIVIAAAAAGVLGYGTHPVWAQFNHGIDFIIWSRRLQWPLIVVALGMCVTLLALVVAGKRRAWWLVALLPILALFLHRFVTGPARMVEVVEDPPFVEADQATFLQDDDYVVGVRFADAAYAFPYSVLYNAPAIVLSDRERRMILIWSAFANRAVAFGVSRELRARDLEIVSTPANALLLYNSRLGQFVNGITAQTTRGDKPTGFRDPLPAVKLTWSAWKAASPETRVMSPLDLRWRSAPRGPVLPKYPLPRSRPELTDDRRVCVIATTQPIAVPSEAVKDLPLNLSAGRTPVLLVRESSTGSLRAFDRRIDEDLSLRFATATDAKHANVVLADADTNTEWSIAGAAVEGPKETHGKTLTPIPVEDELYWGVMKFWYPDLKLVGGDALAAAVGTPSQPATVAPQNMDRRARPTTPTTRRRRRQ
jgi:hypothetical protein